MRKFIAAGVLLVALTANSSNQEAANPADSKGSAATATDAQPAEKKICKRVEATESRLAAKRVCKTAEEWKRSQD